MMIFERERKYNSIYGEFIIHILIFITISLSLFSSNPIIDFTLLTCMIIFLSKGHNINWYYSLLIFSWGIYSDLIIGYPIGYSSTLFLSFLVLNQLSNFFGVLHLQNMRFSIFFIGLIFVVIIEHFTIYFQYGTNISIFIQVLEVLFVLLFYFPINYLMKNNFNLYVPKE